MSSTPATAQRSASATALGVAALRAAHHALDAEPRILDDPIAERLLEPRLRAAIRGAPDRFQSAEQRAWRAHVVARARFTEDALCAAAGRGVEQYVLLGAGLDTFAYRQPGWAHSLTIFEVDHPASQRDKRVRLADAGIAAPGNVRYVPADLERDDVLRSLAHAGLDRRAPVFFSLLGVLAYLERGPAERLLSLVASLGAPHELVLTFAGNEQADSGGRTTPSLATRAASLGEPWRLRLDETAVVPWLLGLGFAEARLVEPAELHARYFAGRSDDLPAPHRPRIVAAGRR